jgi:hypothetical protein
MEVHPREQVHGYGDPQEVWRPRLGEVSVRAFRVVLRHLYTAEVPAWGEAEGAGNDAGGGGGASGRAGNGGKGGNVGKGKGKGKVGGGGGGQGGAALNKNAYLVRCCQTPLGRGFETCVTL